MKTWLFVLVVVACPSMALTTPLRPSVPQSPWTWSRDFATVPLPSSSFNFGIAVMDAGQGPELFVGGDFWGATGYADWVVRWSPATGWRGLGPPYLNDWVNDIAVYDDGTGPALFAGGAFNDLNRVHMARWKPGVGWSRMPDPGYPLTSGCQVNGGWVEVLAVHDDGSGPGLYAGGRFGAAACFSGNVASNKIIRYDGTGFHSLAGGVDDGLVDTLCSFDDGSGPALYVSGPFTSIGGVPFHGLARWRSGAWSGVGNTQLDPGYQAAGLVVFDDGSGPRLHATIRTGGAWVLSKWDGTSWTALYRYPGNPNGAVSPILAFDDGRGPGLYCVVNFANGPSKGLARWNGHSLTGLGQGLSLTSGSGGWIYDMIVYDAGRGPELHMCGHFTRAGGGIASRGVASWHSALGPIDLICPGDQTFVACPCANGAPQHGCANSFDPTGGLLTTTGATPNDSLTFTAVSLPPNAAALLFQGDAFISNRITVPPYGLPHFGEGLRCAGGNLRRLFTKTAVSGVITAPELSDPSIRARVSAFGDLLAPGSQRFYQLWYRDMAPGFCGSAAEFNTTNGVRVVW